MNLLRPLVALALTGPMSIAVTIVAASASPCPGQQYCILPNALLTHGAIRTTNTQDVCTTRTSTIRNVPPSLKAEVYKRYGITRPSKAMFEAAVPPGAFSPMALAARKRAPLQIIAGHPGQNGAEFEVDHLIPLELGGSNDITNLWPQSYLIADNAWMKDQLEHRLHELVCDGTITLTDAQQEIANNWIDAWQRYAKAQ